MAAFQHRNNEKGAISFINERRKMIWLETLQHLLCGINRKLALGNVQHG